MKGRQRGRNGGGGGKPRPPGRNPNFDGGNNRPRGNAQQLMEKYLALARDASSAGDRVLAENYFQHADHYYRVLNARFEQQNGQQRRFDGQGQGQHPQQYDRSNPYGNEQRPYEGEQQPQQQPQGGYGGQPHHQAPHQQQHHHHAVPAAPEPGNEAEIALPPGILGEAPQAEASNEPQDEAGESQDGGQEFHRGRDRGRRRRGRGDRSYANAGE
ncbi:MAG: DUF4167 domain-containing protein [Rhodospirillaceae bacterium]